MTNLKVSWDSVQNADSYNLYWSTSPGVTINNGIAITGITDVVYYHNNLQDAINYYYIVVAVDRHGNLGPASVEFNAHASLIVGIEITPSNTTHLISETQQYTAVLKYSSGTAIDITGIAIWDTSNHAVATINSNGLATAVSSGTVTVTAAYNIYMNNATLVVS